MTLKGHNIFKSVWIISTLALLTSAPVAADAEEHAAIDSGMIRDHTVPLVQTPAQFKPRHKRALSIWKKEKKSPFSMPKVPVVCGIFG